MSEQDIFNAQVFWFIIIITIVFSTILVILINFIIKYNNLEKIVHSQQKLINELAKLEITKNKTRINNGEI